MNQRETGFADIDARVAGNAAAAPERHVGRPMPRFEDPAILTGRGRYGDDLAVKPGTLQAAILRSPHAHADIVSIDIEAASKLHGVRTILTRDDLRPWSRPFVVGVKSPMEQWALAMDRVRYVGEPVAVVMAESRAIAEDALDLIKVDYALRDPVTSIEQAVKDEAPVLHERVGTNVISDRHFSYGDPQAAFERAPHRVKLVAHYPRNTCAPIECGVVIAEYLSGDEGYDGPCQIEGRWPYESTVCRIPSDYGVSVPRSVALQPYQLSRRCF
ncbi:xanthine dehydrogenase family protein molybdopterin-binding subunit, partial [Burkholderia vietnamiensis]|uniref:xanthine dehydrogenase family protein molybdopterin-binding subunit n=1 Tax=Burkholderia vietnamiensis TaxID=60552 RepID=UPI001B9EA7BC